MRRPGGMRPQAIVVIFVVLVLLSRGEGRFLSDAQDAASISQQHLALATPDSVIAEPTTENAAQVFQPTVAPPTRTPVPSTPEPSPSPTPTPSPEPTSTPQPTPTPEPVATQRPEPPPSTTAEMAEVVMQPSSGRREIALTFDAGGEVGYTMDILALLDQYGAVGTFGVTGEWATNHPDLVNAIVERGHQVINHGYTHDSFTGHSTGGGVMPDHQVRAEVLDTAQAIRAATGGYEVAPFFRFPYGDYNGSILEILKQLGYDFTIWWGCDSKAWMGHTADDIVRECGREKAAPGLIVLLHVDTQPDYIALPQLLEIYTAEGYDLVAVEQLMQP